MTVNVDNAAQILAVCLTEAQQSAAGQTATDGKRVTTSLVRAVNRARQRALDIQ